MSDKIVAYKAFDDDLSCRGFKYKIGESYVTDSNISVCNNGFHACLNPFDCFNYYDMTGNRFAVVELSGDTDQCNNDTKIAAAKITIKAELSLSDFIIDGVKYITNLIKPFNQRKDTDYQDEKEESAQIGSSGDSAKIGSTGDYAKIGSTGDYAKIGSSGYSAQIGSSGDYAKIGSSGDYAKIGSTGDSAQIGSSGYSAQIEAEGESSVISACGTNTRAKGKKETWISIAEYNQDGKCIGFAVGCIGRDGLKEDTWYMAKDGMLVEIQE